MCPDSPANQVLGRSKSGRGEGVGAFPQVRGVGLVEAATHAIIDAVQGPYASGEQTLARDDGLLGPGVLLLADRLFVGAELWRAMARPGAELVWRVECGSKTAPNEQLPAQTCRPSRLAAADHAVRPGRRRPARNPTWHKLPKPITGRDQGQADIRSRTHPIGAQRDTAQPGGLKLGAAVSAGPRRLWAARHPLHPAVLIDHRKRDVPDVVVVDKLPHHRVRCHELREPWIAHRQVDHRACARHCPFDSALGDDLWVARAADLDVQGAIRLRSEPVAIQPCAGHADCGGAIFQEIQAEFPALPLSLMDTQIVLHLLVTSCCLFTPRNPMLVEGDQLDQRRREIDDPCVRSLPLIDPKLPQPLTGWHCG